MLFGEKIRELRINRGLTQEIIAEKIGVTARSYQNYEACRLYPKKNDVYGRLVKLFGVKLDYLITDEDQCIIDAHAQGGMRAMKDVQKLVKEVGALFAGGTLPLEDKNLVIKAIVEQYWETRQRNRDKFTPKKYRKTPVAG